MHTHDRNGRRKAKDVPAQPAASRGLTETSFRGGTPLQALQAHAAPVFGLHGSGPAIHQAAQQGLRTPAGNLPYADQIAASFGRHDVSQIKSHVGSEATMSAAAMDAAAYATGDHVVFTGTPNLHTVAHEAAHVVQQQGGVQLSDGIGQVGDRYEVHADGVAERVTAGQSAEGLLDQFAGPGPAQSGVQRTLWGALRGAVAGAVVGGLAGPVGLVAGLVGGAALGHYGSEQARNPDAEEEEEDDEESQSKPVKASGSARKAHPGEAKRGERKTARESDDTDASDDDAPDASHDDFAERLGAHLKKPPAKPKASARPAAGPPRAAAAAPAATPQAEINAEVRRIMGIIDRSRNEGDHLEVLSDYVARDERRIHAGLRTWHRQPARGHARRIYYVSNSLSRGIHVTIHKTNAKGADQFETTANYHIR